MGHNNREPILVHSVCSAETVAHRTGLTYPDEANARQFVASRNPLQLLAGTFPAWNTGRSCSDTVDLSNLLGLDAFREKSRAAFISMNITCGIMKEETMTSCVAILLVYSIYLSLYGMCRLFCCT